jgi:hypothetical protein
MGAPVLAMPRAYHASGTLRGGSQGSASAWRDGANALLDQCAHAASMGLKSCEYGGKKRIVAPACSISVRTPPALCAAKLSRTTMSPRRRRGTSRRCTHAVNRGVVIAPQAVLSVSHRSTRIAPTSVRLSPQFRGRGSTSSLPRSTHACDRPIARFAPDSSRKTKRRTSTPPIQSRKARRCAWTTGLSCSAGRGRFF